MDNWVAGVKKKKKPAEDEDGFDPREWDVDSMSQEQIKKELDEMEAEE